jgi:hypothetical protein
MSRLFFMCLAFAGWLPLAAGGQGPTAPVAPRTGPAVAEKENRPPLPPPVPSPVAIFRELLAQTPAQRISSLGSRPPEARQRLLAKVLEYQRMTPEEREFRLRATELRWYLTPLLSLPATNRAARLAQVPADLRPLVEQRLLQWSVLPPPLRDQVLEEDRNLQLYLRLAGSSAEQQRLILERLPAVQRAAAEAGFARWQGLTVKQREDAMVRVNRFFELQPAEKRQVLARLSDTERRQMERSLQAFERLPREMRARCLEAFPKFASLSPEQRAGFLASAERWQAMTPSERELFRRLVQQAPVLPPLPRTTPPVRPATAGTNRGG